ncbi:hypothetical protein [Chitinimonas sp. BJYL2]|uniref:hypothetical protein n=1 Tax=Chitinimonas sp. BJYL2 TaxID=2976696 RepID=UPI0022B379E9|nr:hypothetical protein [Chitinimonas sp. BJYL2]
MSTLIKSSTFALFVAGLLMLVVGTYTNNGGFQLAGGMLGFISLIMWISNAGRRNGQD